MFRTSTYDYLRRVVAGGEAGVGAGRDGLQPLLIAPLLPTSSGRVAYYGVWALPPLVPFPTPCVSRKQGHGALGVAYINVR